jgi:hypothetical protein
MNDKTGSNRNLRCARALAVAAAAAVLTAGCGVVHVHFGSSGGPRWAGEGKVRQAMTAHALRVGKLLLVGPGLCRGSAA